MESLQLLFLYYTNKNILDENLLLIGILVCKGTLRSIKLHTMETV